MATSKYIAALLLVGSQLLAPVFATTNDAPLFNIWFDQWAKFAGLSQVQRLPCLRAGTRTCSGLFASAVAGAHDSRRAGAVNPFAKPKHTMRTVKRRVVFKNTARVKSPLHKTSASEVSSGRFSGTASYLVLSDGGRNILGVDLDQPDDAPPTEIDTLANYVAEVDSNLPRPHAPTPTSGNNLLTDATGGVGDSAFVSLYDFEDESGNPTGNGEAQRGFQEIPSLLNAPTSLAAIAVPEPGTLLLLGLGLLVWQARAPALFRDGRLRA